MKPELLAPCGLYCGVCGVYMASRDNNETLKGKLAKAYKVNPEQIACSGCLSDKRFVYCQTCEIRTCAMEKNRDGCHQCDTFPCNLIDDFPVPVGKRVILRSVPARKKLGTQTWVKQEEARHECPQCHTPLFRGARRCASCKTPVEIH